jgi:CrcB protein
MGGAATYLSVALGGAVGASLRYAFGRMTLRLFGDGFPWGTFGVNVIGSLAMGLAAALMLERFPGDWSRFAPFLMTGVLGGFTTFSAFSLDVLALIERGEQARALLYASGTVSLTVAALWTGLVLGRLV